MSYLFSLFRNIVQFSLTQFCTLLFFNYRNKISLGVGTPDEWWWTIKVTESLKQTWEQEVTGESNLLKKFNCEHTVFTGLKTYKIWHTSFLHSLLLLLLFLFYFHCRHIPVIHLRHLPGSVVKHGLHFVSGWTYSTFSTHRC